MAFCSSCGAQMEENAAFCPACGAQSQAPAQAPVQPQAPMYVKPKIPGRGFGISAMVLGIIGLVYSVYMLAGFEAVVKELKYYALWNSVEQEMLIIGAVVACLLYAVLSILAVSFAAAAKKRGYVNNVRKAGLVTGVIGLCLYAASAVMMVAELA